MDAVELQEQQPPEKDGPRRVAFQPDPPKRSSMSEPLLVDAEPEAHRFIQSSRRSKTEMHKVKVERRPMHHKHIFRRPRALQYKTFKEEQEGQEEQEGAAPSNSPSASTSTSRSNSISASRSNSITAARSASVSTLGAKAHEGEERSTHNVAKQRSRLDLFVDLIWVGIIANLSATFGDQSFSDSGIGIGWAYMEFMLLFIVIWRVWDSLRVYTSHFFIDDIMQRNFTLWILVLAVLYGINAPFAYRPHGEHDEFTLVIVIYIVAKFSFLAAHGFQALFIPWLRRQWLFQAAGVVVISAFWTGVIFAPNWTGKIVLIIIANAVEHPITLFMASPTSDRLFVPGRKRYTDVEHHVERYENFFIVILGEGVFRLVNGSPSGMGLNANTGTVLQALLLYYVLHWLYFNGDQCKEYVHALRRTWWKPVVWQL
jgi:low temperature requirement protein LtrA